VEIYRNTYRLRFACALVIGATVGLISFWLRFDILGWQRLF